MPLLEEIEALERKAEELRQEKLRRYQSKPENIRARVLEDFPEKLKFLFEPHRFKVAWSGREGIKSWQFSRALLSLGLERPLRILCARETQKAIKDSVHKLLSDQIKLLSLQSYYEIQESAIYGSNGTEFFFAGLKHNINNIKSIEGCDIVWVEEAQNVSKKSWDTLIPTIRKEGSEIWVSFNPDLSTDETYKRFVMTPPPSSMVVRTSYLDNKWITEATKREIAHMYATDPATAANVYGGETRSTVVGAIYEKEIGKAETEGRVTRVPYDRARPVDTFWDLGYGDMVSIWFCQSIAFEYRVLDYYQNRHQAIDFYLKVLQEKEYTYGTCYFPWDGGARQLGTGKSIEELTRAKGFKVKVVPQASVTDGINAVRTIFPQLYFDNDRCTDGLSAIRHYQWGPPSATGLEKRAPLHDINSHACDALRVLAMSVQPPKPKASENQGARSPWADVGRRDIPDHLKWMAGLIITLALSFLRVGVWS